jgi:hypothetical protein
MVRARMGWVGLVLASEDCFGMKSLGDSAVVSHISRKTSEMWGTRGLWLGQGLKSDGGASPRLFRPRYAWANLGHPSCFLGF